MVGIRWWLMHRFMRRYSSIKLLAMQRSAHSPGMSTQPHPHPALEAIQEGNCTHRKGDVCWDCNLQHIRTGPKVSVEFVTLRIEITIARGVEEFACSTLGVCTAALRRLGWKPMLGLFTNHLCRVCELSTLSIRSRIGKGTTRLSDGIHAGRFRSIITFKIMLKKDARVEMFQFFLISRT